MLFSSCRGSLSSQPSGERLRSRPRDSDLTDRRFRSRQCSGNFGLHGLAWDRFQTEHPHRVCRLSSKN